MLLYLPAPLYFILSTRQLDEVTLQLHQNFTISPQMETQLQDNVCKNPEPLSVSSHCGPGKLNFHRANELVTRSGLELHHLDHDEALHARNRESLESLEGLDSPWNLWAQCSWTTTKMTAFIMMQQVTDEALFWKCLSPTGQTGWSQSMPFIMRLPNGNTGKSPNLIQLISRMSHGSKKIQTSLPAPY